MKRITKIALFLTTLTALFTLIALSASATDDRVKSIDEEAQVYRVSFADGSSVLYEATCENGATVAPPDVELPLGYEAVGWFLDTDLTVPYMQMPITADTTVYLSKRLVPPEYRISKLDVTYDRGVHYLSLDELTHPLLGECVVYQEWFKNGVSVGAGEMLAVKNVSDSGEYYCRITLTHGRASTTVTTPPVTVTVRKQQLTAPEIDKKAYNGREQFPELAESPLYTYSYDGGISAGLYPVFFTLTDSENYAWSESSEKTVTTYFEITRAENRFISELSVFDVYFVAEGSFFASSLFGEVHLVYRSEGSDEPLSELPLEAGAYTVSAVVEGTSDYTALTSPRLPFSILEERALGITVLTLPRRTEYVAFENFDPSGITVSVSFNSGRTEVFASDELTCFYQTGASLHAGDNLVYISYKDAVASVPVSVTPTEYDLTDVVFDDLVLEYNATFLTGSVPELPIGEDGIPLQAVLMGGGTDAGIYKLGLVFFTESENYLTPEPLYATLTVAPKSVTLIWENTVFTYSGTLCVPSASFTDLFGNKVTVGVTGGKYSAGESYVATAEMPVNYTFTNPTCTFTVNRADYDVSGVFWSADSFVYSGEEYRVTLHGLPDGVSVTGYANNTAKGVGEYVAAAGVIYDERNFNPPVLPTHTWYITPAAYDMSCVSFSSLTAVFDGNVHYPTVEGEMPTGADGITLSYTFSAGAVHVSDGMVEVTVTFSTESPNYTAPSPVVRTVNILPAPVFVSWQGLVFTYDGSEHLPIAAAAECEIYTEGASINAGEYTARAFSASADYYVVNATVTFIIEKADNAFIDGPYVYNTFEGHPLEHYAVAIAGEVNFTFFKDVDCTEPAESFIPGVYFAVAEVAESENYNALGSAPIRFEVIRVVPVSISADLFADGGYVAFECIPNEALKVLVSFNDGSVIQLSSDEFSVIYQNGDSLRFGDTVITVIYGGHAASCPVPVSRASYDMSGVRWTDLRHTYDGTEKSASLEGLPSGVGIYELDGGCGTRAGEYPVSVRLTYDTDNYNEPTVEDAVMVIERAVVSVPILPPLSYNGGELTLFSPSPLYTVTTAEQILNAGSYTVSVSLTDAENYVFSNGEPSALTEITVEPRELLIRVGDVQLYLFERYSNPDIEIIGDVCSKDDLGLTFVRSGERITVTSSNPNYRITVEDGRVIRVDSPSPRMRTVLTVIILLLILLVLLIIALIIQHRRIAERIAAAVAKRRIEKRRREERSVSLLDEESGTQDQLSGFLLPMDSEKADTLISNSLARELIAEEVETVYTDGWRKSVINVDTLSESFSGGDRIDVNILKSKSLIPYDTAYIKVLARGAIDKPLYVYANSFSRTAVKMLALTGGRAVKVTTVRGRKNQDTEK